MSVSTDMAGLPGLAGTHLGYTDWATMEQSRVDLFADATDDHQFIHVDPERARATPFGGTVAHGYLTLALAAPALGELLTISDARMAVNYGLDKVRFPAPLPVGSRWRAGLEVTAVGEVSGGLQIHSTLTIEVEGAERPACVAALIARVYG